ncbi:MAG: Translation initiation factor 1A [Candidatus Diapherotrites archaeon ADurb.Bin253]|jgi:translation initiation factor 1A|nr:MAG: Translation initiation factor 1A [Candidatus Diapherotrites archaeon ADurb.Bin253]HNZ52185.1 translation initiation factor eIF-1A [Candidatus Pacearchaeota archaeon]HOH04298.1 translation initiation factor eIF-1A [Candidatus Pacearchaeota archaeon]HOU79480.1 translation initiation factor eIF-1A [Candidatus Pacearchaeota archaeon]HPX74526.1 translation initiation factor eIF-1A [Candidatus Pacearchaeota archaeon]
MTDKFKENNQEFSEEENEINENENSEEIKIARAKIPRGEEVIGIIEERLGGNKMKVKCLDGKTRNSRVPGRLKRKLWLRPGDTVLVEPWELDKSKGDVIFKYPSNQIEWLKRNGYLKTEEKEF